MFAREGSQIPPHPLEVNLDMISTKLGFRYFVFTEFFHWPGVDFESDSPRVRCTGAGVATLQYLEVVSLVPPDPCSRSHCLVTPARPLVAYVLVHSSRLGVLPVGVRPVPRAPGSLV